MIIQSNIFICDSCGNIVTCSYEVKIYTDPVINPPKDWFVNENEDDKLLCDECKVK